MRILRTLSIIARRARVRRGWSTHEVARRCRMSERTIRRFENGDSVNMGTAEKILAVLHIDLVVDDRNDPRRRMTVAVQAPGAVDQPCTAQPTRCPGSLGGVGAAGKVRHG